jgi:hypothetical protein
LCVCLRTGMVGRRWSWIWLFWTRCRTASATCSRRPTRCAHVLIPTPGKPNHTRRSPLAELRVVRSNPATL